MRREVAIEGFRQINTANEIARNAVNSMQEAGVETSFSILTLFHHGIILESMKLNREEERRFLAYMETYLADTREALGMYPNQSFDE